MNTQTKTLFHNSDMNTDIAAEFESERITKQRSLSKVRTEAVLGKNQY